MVERKEIEHIASLAKLNIGRDTDRLAADMQAIINMVDELSEIELDMDSYPLDMELVNTFREDTPGLSIPREDVLANAPAIEAGCISVPKMLGGGEE